MKQFVKSFATSQASQVQSTTHALQWIESSFDVENVPTEAIKELKDLAEVAQGKEKIALFDLFRLLVLKEAQAEYILRNHWDLIQVSIIGFLSSYSLEDSEARVTQNCH